MTSNASTTRHRPPRRASISSASEKIETIDLDEIPSLVVSSCSTTVSLPVQKQENENLEESPLFKIIERKQRKDWAKLVASVDEDKIKKNTESVTTRLSKSFAKIPSPIRFLLDFIEHRYGYTIRSYFEFIVWLFYLNLFTFLICFTCIIMPTYIYPNSRDFASHAMDQYYQNNRIPVSNHSSEQCTLSDPQCQALNIPLSNQGNASNETCLNNPFTAGSCCSLYAEAFSVNSSRESENDWTKFLVDLTDGTGYLTLTRLFIGYYQNLTKSETENSYFQTYNMGLAVFLTISACFLLTAIIILRKYGDGMKQSYVQNESFNHDLFQYIFARWNYRITNHQLAHRHKHRFQTEIKNIFFEQHEKIHFQFDRAKDKILFQLERIAVWIVTLMIFAGAIAALYFTIRFTFQERAKKEMNNGATESSRARDLIIEYLPSIVISGINLISQTIFAFMRDWKLYTYTASLRHYLIRVIIMRLVLLFVFVFIVILQITCNSNQCGKQSELINCAEIQGQATFIHCWETLIGQVIYRLVLTDTAVVILVHLIVDPLRSLLNYCCVSRATVEEENGSAVTTYTPPKPCFLFLPLEFEVGDYVLDLTYTQTLCWHGLLFSPFLPLIGAVNNILIFGIKLFSLALMRRRSALELSPARARYIFTAVLLFSFVWALLPITFLATSLRPSRGCSPFRLYSNEPDFYIYYSVRNLLAQIPNEIFATILFKLTSAVVIIPVILILILFSCVLTIRRNSYRGASVELYKLLYSSHKTHRLAVQSTNIMTTTL